MANFFQNVVEEEKKKYPSLSSYLSPDVVSEPTGQMQTTTPQTTTATTPGVNFFKDVVQGTLRSAARVGMEVGKTGLGLAGIEPKTEIKPKNFFEELLFGKKPITDIPTYGKETLEQFGVSEEKAKKYGLITGIGLTALDLSWGGGKSGVAKSIARTATMKEAESVIKKLGVNYSDDLAKRIINTKTTQEATKLIDDLGKQTVKVAPKELEPLAIEARKYKSAEEFVKAQGKPFYHGSNIQGIKKLELKKPTDTVLPESISFTSVKNMAGQYIAKGKTKGEIYERYIFPKKSFVLREDQILKDALPNMNENQVKEYLNKNGYDSIVKKWPTSKDNITPIKADTIIVLDESIIKTKSQLTDIYNQAVKGVGEAKITLPTPKILPAVQEEFGQAGKLSRLTPEPKIPEPLKPEILTSETLTKPYTETTKKAIKERGFITSVKEAMPELNVAGQYVPRTTDELAIKARTLIKENLITAEKMAQGTDDKAVAVGAELLKHYSDEATKATDDIVKNALYDKAGKLANDMARKLTEQGRSVQAASILGRLTPEGQLRFAAREIQKYNEAIEATRGGILGLKKKIPEITQEQSQKIIEEMNTIKGMIEGTEKAMRFQKLQDYISTLVPTPLFKKVIAVWKAGLLTGMKTTGVNIFANVSHQATEVAKDIPATIVDKITSLFTGKRAVSFTTKGELTGAEEGIKKGIRYLKTGFDERNIGAKLDYTKVNFGKGKLAKGLQKYTDAVFHLLGAEDQPFYYATKTRSLWEQAKVGAINKGLKGQEAQKFINELFQNPTEQMIKNASFDAETAVFQNQTLLGKAARAIQKTGVGEVVVPFGRTPSAVAMQIVNYSPVGIVKTIIENIGKGRFDQRLFSQGLGRGLTGMGAMAIGAYLMKKGLITTSRPTGEKEQKLWELEGKQANSIKIGDKYRQVQVLGPVGNLLLLGGIFQREFDKSGSPSEAMAGALADASRSFTQQTFLTGVSNFIDAISDPARSAENVAGSTLASTIPTIISDVARAIDTKERRTNEILEKFQARIPGIRETLEPQITVLGEEKETIGNPLEIMMDPTRPSLEKSTPLIQELRRLWDAGFKVSPTLLGDKKGYEALTPEQNTKLWKKAGEIINEKLSNLITRPEYQKLDDEQKSKYVDNFVDKAKINARVGMVLELTQGLQGKQLGVKLSELKKSGLLTKEVFNKWKELR